MSHRLVSERGRCYFAYGSNLHHQQMADRCPDARFVGSALLAGYRLAFTRRSERWGGGVADIVPTPGSELWGAVWELSATDECSLDEYEGVRDDPPAYRRTEVTVSLAAGSELTCLSYQVVSPAAEHIPPSPRYLDSVIHGARDSGLPPPYVAQLEAITTALG